MNNKVETDVLRFILVVFTYIASLSICCAQTATLDSEKTLAKIRIDPTAAMAGIDALLFDSIRYVPLETNSNAAFSTISALEVTENFFVILDNHLNSLFFFQHDGRFSHKISKNEEGKPFRNLRKFSIDQSKGIIFVDDSMSPNLCTFELSGNLVETIARGTVDEFQYFNGYKITYNRAGQIFANNEVGFKSIVCYDAKTDQKLGEYLPADSVRKNWRLPVNPKSFYRSENDRLLFVQPYDYTVYEFDRNGIPFTAASIIFPAQHTLPPDFLINTIYHNKWSEYLRVNRSVIHSLRDTYFSGQWLSFYPFMGTNSGALLYNTETHDLFNLSETMDSSLGLPITEGFEGVLGVFEGALITQMPFISLKTIYEDYAIEDQKKSLPENLVKLMKSKSSNPILRLTYLKQNYPDE